MLNKYIADNRCEIPNIFERDFVKKKVATLRVIVQTSYEIFNEKLVFPMLLPYYFIHIHVLHVLCCLF